MAVQGDSQEKTDREVMVFLEFLSKSGFDVCQDSVEKRHPPEPDIRCIHSNDGPVAFELVELCDPDVAQIFNRWSPPPVTAAWLGGPDLAKIGAKFNKPYSTDAPIELLCYTRSRLATPDSVLLPTICHEIDFSRQTTFRRVWYMGELETRSIYSAR